MLTKKQNLLETIRGGKPDRFVNQFEFYAMTYSDPINMCNPRLTGPGPDTIKDFWGVTWAWPEGTPGAFPVQTSDKLPITDIEKWKEQICLPSLSFPEEVWKAAAEDYAKQNRDEMFVGPYAFPGLFDFTHYQLGIEEALVAFYTNPEEMHGIIHTIQQWHMNYLGQVADRLHPDLLMVHDDWGSSQSTFISPEMFAEFFLEPYKELYSFCKKKGYELIVHHSDSYAATFVPYMIEMGIDIWQGGTAKNNIPELIRKYGGQISFMTGIESSLVDAPNWTEEKIAQHVEEVFRSCGKNYFIPCQTQGGNESSYPEVYNIISREIERMSGELF